MRSSALRRKPDATWASFQRELGRTPERSDRKETVRQPQGHRQDHDEHADAGRGAAQKDTRRSGSDVQRAELYARIRQRTPAEVKKLR